MPSYRNPTVPTAREIAWLTSLAQPTVSTQSVGAVDSLSPNPAPRMSPVSENTEPEAPPCRALPAPATSRHHASMTTRHLIAAACLVVAALSPFVSGCSQKQGAEEVIVYCGVDEPYASKIFADFEAETGIHVAVQYDIESSKSVGLAGKLEAERDHPRADVWWGGEAFLSVRLASEDILQPYASPAAADIPAKFKDPGGRWTGSGLRARVLAVSTTGQVPPFPITSFQDLADPRLKDKVCMSRPTAGATGAHLASMYVLQGPEKARDFLGRLQANGIALLGGNAEVADQVGAGIYALGLTDSDDILNTQANGGKLNMVVPDQSGAGTLALPSTVGLVTGAHHPEAARKLIDYLVSRKTEEKLIKLHFSRWSVRASDAEADAIKTVTVDLAAAAKIFGQAQREATAILEGRQP